MKPLFYLWYLQTKAQIRYIFRKLSSTLLTLLLLLVYGGILVFSFFNCNSEPMIYSPQLNNSILFMIGFLALMVFTTLLSPKKALFMGEDAYYLFCGPFLKRHILSYLMFQTFQQAFFIEIFIIYMFAATSIGLTYHWLFYLLMLISVYLVLLIFLVLTDFFYLSSMVQSVYKKIPYVLFGIFLCMTGYVFIKEGSLSAFMQSTSFYIIPIFGWLKWLLMSLINNNITHVLIALGLLIITAVISISLLVSYNGDFYEQALNDGLELSKMRNEAKEGKISSFEKVKIKNKTSTTFKDGAFSIVSKNILVMKKTGQWITKNDLMILGMYIVLSIVMDLGFGFFVYLLLMYVFSTLQQSTLYQDLQNYRIYLIPDSPIKKLISIIIPTFIKLSIVCSITLIIMGIYYHIDLKSLLSYAITLLGYISIFMSSSVLSIRLLGNRSSPIFENIIRMLLMLICSIPSIIIIYFMLTHGINNSLMMFIYANSSVIMNFIISSIILYLCKDMMNGRELKGR